MIRLEDAQITEPSAVKKAVYNTFRANSVLLDKLPFDDAAAVTGGGSFDYNYTQQKTVPAATTRAIGTDFVPDTEVQYEPQSLSCVPVGRKFTVDRAVYEVHPGIVARETSQSIEAARAKLQDMLINGVKAGDGKSFDGLSKLLAGTVNEFGADELADNEFVDWTLATVNSAAAAAQAMEVMDSALGSLDGPADLILGSTATLNRLATIGRLGGYITAAEDAFGKPLKAYNGVSMVDLKNRPGSGDPIVKEGELYVVRLGEDGFHGVTPAGRSLISTHLPNFTTTDGDAIKSGAVEMLVAAALKSARAAAVIRNLKVK